MLEVEKTRFWELSLAAMAQIRGGEWGRLAGSIARVAISNLSDRVVEIAMMAVVAVSNSRSRKTGHFLRSNKEKNGLESVSAINDSV